MEFSLGACCGFRCPGVSKRAAWGWQVLQRTCERPLSSGIATGGGIPKSSSGCFSVGKSQAPGQYTQWSPDNRVGPYLFYGELNVSLGSLTDLIISPLTTKGAEMPSVHVDF